MYNLFHIGSPNPYNHLEKKTFLFCCPIMAKSGKSHLVFHKTRLPIVTMNDYRHFATGPYSRGAYVIGCKGCLMCASIAQGLEHWSCKPGVGSSNLPGGYTII